DSGPLQWSKKAKTECPNPNSHSTILQRLLFVHQKLRLAAEHPSPDLVPDLTRSASITETADRMKGIFIWKLNTSLWLPRAVAIVWSSQLRDPALADGENQRR